MTISYSGLRSYGKSTLPSVEGGMGSMNIIKDPPKSIHTKKKDMVGVNSDITQSIDDSGDRIAEVLTQYARGVNPMVNVSYNNYGNNGGQRSGSMINPITINQSSRTPYSLGNKMLFRPPVDRQEDLLPISRVPKHKVVNNFIVRSKVDYTKSRVDQNIDVSRNLKKVINNNVKATKTLNIQSPIIENYEVKNVIKNPIKVIGKSGKGTRNIADLVVVKPKRSVLYDKKNMSATPNKSISNVTKSQNYNKKTDKYIQDSNVSEVITNKSEKKQFSSNITTNLNISTKNAVNINFDAPLSKSKNEEYIHKDLNLKKLLPAHQANASKSLNIHKKAVDKQYQIEFNRNMPLANTQTKLTGKGETVSQFARSKKILPTLSASQFLHNSGKMTSYDYSNNNEVKLVSKKNDISKSAFKNVGNRFNTHIPSAETILAR